MRTAFAVIATMAMLAGPAYAQMGMEDQRAKDPWLSKLDREQKARDEAEKDYSNAMKRLKAQTPTAVANDPWRTVRPTPTTGSDTAKTEPKR